MAIPCWVRLYAPEMSACDATMVAAVDSATIGYMPQAGTSA